MASPEVLVERTTAGNSTPSAAEASGATKGFRDFGDVPLRIARVITRMNRGGPARTIVSIQPFLEARGVETRLLTGSCAPGEADLIEDARAAGVDVRVIPALARQVSPWRDTRAYRALVSELRAFRPDLVHTHTFKAGLLGRLAARRCRIPRIHTFHGHVFRGYFRPWVASGLVRLERRLARRTNRLIAVSPRVREELVDVYRIADSRRFAILPGVLAGDLEAPEVIPASTELPPKDAPWVGCLARLTEIKNPWLLLDVAKLVNGVRRVHFLWIGDGELRARFEREAETRGLAEVVHCMGWQEHPGVWHRLLDAELLLSKNEGLPVSLLEAKALGVPVIASQVGGVADLFEPGDPGLVAEGNAGATSEAVLDCLTNSDQWRSRARRQVQEIRKKYSPERHAVVLTELYSEVLGEVS